MESNETNEETKMLNINEIKFPITFNVQAVGKIKFEDKHRGVWVDSGSESAYQLSYFVEKHNYWNKKNDPNKDFHYVDASGVSDIPRTADIMNMIQSGNYIGSGWRISKGNKFINDAFITVKECKIEDMPLGATIQAIKVGDDWQDIRVKPLRIEIHDDIICLLAHSAYSKTGFSCEVNIKRGMMIRYK